MHQCVVTEVRERRSLWAIYTVDSSEMSLVPLISSSEGSRVTMSDSRPLSLYILYLPWDTHSIRRQGCMHTLPLSYTHIYTHIHTEAPWTSHLNSCSADMMVATCSHPCNPSRQTKKDGHCVCVCVSVSAHSLLGFNVWFQPAVKTVICVHLCLTKFHPATWHA